MALKVEKPNNPQDFINKAKADGAEDKSTMKEKSFIIRMPYPLWKKAKHKSTDNDITLHDFILEQIKKGV